MKGTNTQGMQKDEFKGSPQKGGASFYGSPDGSNTVCQNTPVVKEPTRSTLNAKENK